MNANIQVLHPDYAQMPTSHPVISTAGRNLGFDLTSSETPTVPPPMQTVSYKQSVGTVKQPHQLNQMSSKHNKRLTQTPRRTLMKTTTKPTIQALQTVALTGLLSLVFLSQTVAADFSGSLKGVTITDAQAANKAPIATFTYTKNGDIITFDASSSSDPDGSIAKYKWDFNNGVISEGMTTTYTLKDIANLQVTLTVIDNNNGAALNQQTVVVVSDGINDDFSSNTIANYTAINGSISISGGNLGGGTAWVSNYAIHNNPTGSNDHYVQGKIQSGGTTAGGTIGLRSNGSTGYLVCLNADSSRLYLYAFNGKALTGNPNGNYPKPITGSSGAGSYTVKLTISGSTIHAYIDLNNNGVFTDANEDLGVWTDTTYSTGQYVVVGALRGSDNSDYRVDNFSGGLL
jgi:hypothetical protein